MKKGMRRALLLLFVAAMMLATQACGGSKGLDGTSWKISKMMMADGTELPLAELMGDAADAAAMTFTKDKVTLSILGQASMEMDYTLKGKVITIADGTDPQELDYDGDTIILKDEDGSQLVFEKIK